MIRERRLRTIRVLVGKHTKSGMAEWRSRTYFRRFKRRQRVVATQECDIVFSPGELGGIARVV
jgi:hypothetical protein